MDSAITGITDCGDILHLSFNQDGTWIAVGTETGFFVCDTNPLSLRFRRQFDEGIGIVEMLFRSNIIALVGGGRRPKYQPNWVMIWDDHKQCSVAELEFRSPVKAVKMRRDRIIVALESKLYIYNFEDLRVIGQFDIAANINTGSIAVSPSSSNVLAFPSTNIGEVCWHVVAAARNSELRSSKLVTDSAIEQISLDANGTRLAVTSCKGTLIRVVNLLNDRT